MELVRRLTGCFLAACLLTTLPLQAGAIVLCVEDEPFLPLTNANLNPPGHAQILMATVARNLNIPLQIKFAPWKRCQALVGNGTYDAMLCAAYAGINLQIAVFPMLRTDTPDATRALGNVKTLLYRRKGSTVDFVNGKFINLVKPVGITSGYQVHMVAVTNGGGQFDDSAPFVAQQAKLLMAGRVDLVAGEYAFTKRVKEHYENTLEPLPALLLEAEYYLVFSRHYFSRHKNETEKLWNEIATVRASAAYKTSIKE